MNSLQKLFDNKLPNIFSEIFRYLIVGGIAFIADYFAYSLVILIFKSSSEVTYNLLFNNLTSSEISAVVVGFAFGLTVNYILSNIWVFEGGNRKGLFGTIIFIIVSVIGLLLNFPLLALAKHLLLSSGFLADKPGLMMIIAKLPVTAIVLAWNYCGKKILVYTVVTENK